MTGDGGDHLGECVDRRQVAVDDPERFTIGATDADFDHHAAADALLLGERVPQRADRLAQFADPGLVEVAGRRLIDDATHLQPTDLAGDHAVLHDERRSGRFDHVTDVEVRGRCGGFDGKRFGDRREQRSVDRIPDRDREREALGPSCEQSGRGLRDEVERRRVVADRPGDRTAERAPGVAVDEEPCRAVDDHR